nr:glycosyltransferase [Acetobacter estunensis]
MNENADAASITVVVPVYNAATDLTVCIERLVSHTPKHVDIIFINDHSSDPEIRKILRKASTKYPNIRVLTNKKNMGFSATVNRGIKAARNSDVILLNSDTRVTPRWVEGLWFAAYSGQRIGTATAMSDRAGAFSAPKIGSDNLLPKDIDEISFARTFRRLSFGLYPRVPTGNGFCMYIRRACINDVGLLDHIAFPQGYGEENDFCMRAGRVGWQHVIDDRTYVFHACSKSFGPIKTDLMRMGRAIVDERFPEYTNAIKVFHNSIPLSIARLTAYRAIQSIITGGRVRTRILYVISTQTGGTPQTNIDLMRAFDGDIECWTLRCDSKTLELCHVDNNTSHLVAQHTLVEHVDPITHRSLEYEQVVKTWLHIFDFDLVHIRHLAWHSLELPRIIKKLNCRSVFSFHDFYMISPTIKLIDDTGMFLGDNFSPKNEKNRETLWPHGTQPEPTGAWLVHWRNRNEVALRHCDAFVTTSQSARSLILDYMPSLPKNRFLIIPHGRDFANFASLCRPYIYFDDPIRILLPGNLNIAKGLNIILDLLEYDQAGRLEFHVLGTVKLPSGFTHPRLILHGEYNRDEFAERVEQLHIHAGAIFSIWDETYCHTLTELWSVGVPSFVLNLPNVAKRVRQSGAGWVINYKNTPDLYNTILRTICDSDEQMKKRVALAMWQSEEGIANSTRMMASYYLEIYRDLLRAPGAGTRARVAVVCPSERSLRRANASTVIRIWERCRNAISRDITFIRMRPEALLAAVRLKMVDAVIIQRTALPALLSDSILETMHKAGVRYLLDLDDDLLNVPREKDPNRVYSDYAPTLRNVLNNAHVVTTSTINLCKKLRILAKRVELLPNRLSNRIWLQNNNSECHDLEGVVRVVYMGTTTHESDLALVLPALDAIASLDARFRCSLIGVTNNKHILNSRERWMEIIAVPPEVTYYEQFVPWLKTQARRFSFAIAPLEQTTFNKSKSELKLLEYAGLGLPILASNISIYRDISKSNSYITLCKNDISSWIDGLSNMISKVSSFSSEYKADIIEKAKYFMVEESLKEFDSLVLSMIQDDKRILTNTTLHETKSLLSVSLHRDGKIYQRSTPVVPESDHFPSLRRAISYSTRNINSRKIVDLEDNKNR